MSCRGPSVSDLLGLPCIHGEDATLCGQCYDPEIGCDCCEPVESPPRINAFESESILEEAARITADDRQDSYDHPLDNFGRIAHIWTGILGVPVTPEQVGLCMTGVKLAREAFKPRRDNLVDAAGYVNCIEMIRVERARRSTEEGH